MRINTKFDVGDFVYYIHYKTTVYGDCPLCGEELEDCCPERVSMGKIIECRIIRKNDFSIEENYQITESDLIYIYRNAENVFANKQEAEKALECAKQQYLKEKENKIQKLEQLLNRLQTKSFDVRGKKIEEKKK